TSTSAAAAAAAAAVAGTTSVLPLISTPTPARVKDGGRRGAGGVERRDGRGEVSGGRRGTNQQVQREGSGVPAPHPYAASSGLSSHRGGAGGGGGYGRNAGGG